MSDQMFSELSHSSEVDPSVRLWVCRSLKSKSGVEWSGVEWSGVEWSGIE